MIIKDIFLDNNTQQFVQREVKERKISTAMRFGSMRKS